VDKRAGEYPGDDLGVSMWMFGVAGSGPYPVVVVDQQAAERDIAGIVVFAEREAVVGFGPISLGQEALLRSTQLDARRADPRRTHSFSIAGRLRLRGPRHRRTLASCPLGPSLNQSCLVRNRSGTFRASRRYEQAMRRSL
jgi:hypothetical protein